MPKAKHRGPSSRLHSAFETLKDGVLAELFQKAALMMILVSEIHPFVDGNGRIGRIMMNAELVAASQERITVPTAFRAVYPGSLKASSLKAETTPSLRLLNHALRHTHGIDWRSLEHARTMCEETNAFSQSEEAKLRVDWHTWNIK